MRRAMKPVVVFKKTSKNKPTKQKAVEKRGRPRKNLIQETVECASPDLQSAKRKRGRPPKSPPLVKSEYPKEVATEALLEEPVDHSSPEVTTSRTTKLLKLKPPPESDNYNTSEEHMKVLKGAVALLVSALAEAPDVDKMIDSSVKTFMFLDSIGVHYLPTYEAVHAFISFHCDKECLELQKQGSAFLTKARHDELMSTLSESEQACGKANAKVKDAQNKLIPLRAAVVEKEEELRKAKNELTEGEAELAAAEAEKIRVDDAHSKAEAAFINISHELGNAMMVIEEVETKWEEATAGIRRTRDELLLLTK